MILGIFKRDQRLDTFDGPSRRLNLDEEAEGFLYIGSHNLCVSHVLSRETFLDDLSHIAAEHRQPGVDGRGNVLPQS